MKKGHIIKSVKPKSIADEMEIKAGDVLRSINGNSIKDVFDYHYAMNDENLTMVIVKQNGEEWDLQIEKNYEEDFGIEFEEGLMDQYQSCCNKCMFCFIDQMPPNMRDTLYFKDDDARLSFLQGNYITLTNMKEEDIDRIILYKLAPINISIHTTNPELRNKMLHNRFAGDSLRYIKKLYEAQIEMNSQIVLCKGYNDEEELENTIADLSKILPYMKSLSVVPVGLTKYRDGLVPLEKFVQEDALKVLETIHRWQKTLLKEYGTRFVFASDEWYLTAGLEIPKADYYEGYGQIENGIGMVRSLIDEFEDFLKTIPGDQRERQISLVTGVLATVVIEKLMKQLSTKFPHINIMIYTIKNEFFGVDITVTGLLTGQDIINQLKGKELGDCLILPNTLLRSGEEVLLDDLTVKDIEIALQKEIRIVQSDGKSLIEGVIK
jgi:putative radical SAM enzyme (TIGR03279 family)